MNTMLIKANTAKQQMYINVRHLFGAFEDHSTRKLTIRVH